jgi:poly-gamma-glutamate synthesis protein (capsule biosynthesis protein)
VEEGADLIIGHHPHVIQPIEYFRPERDPDRVAAIAYSLGGLGFRWYTAPHFSLGLILNMQLAKGVTNGITRTYIKRFKPYPVFQHIFLSSLGASKKKRLEKLEDHLENKSSKDVIAYVSQLKQYADLVLGKWVS